MAGVVSLPEPLNMSPNVDLKADGVHIEKVPDEEDIVARMNNLDPPVTREEEKKLLRKIDLRLPPFLFVLYMFTWLDRGALGMMEVFSCLSHADMSTRQFGLDGHQGRSASEWL